MRNHAQKTLRSRRLVCTLLAAIGATLSGASHAQAGRDYIDVTGSSTVFPFAIVVAENFGRRNPNFKTPKIEPTGSGRHQGLLWRRRHRAPRHRELVAAHDC